MIYKQSNDLEKVAVFDLDNTLIDSKRKLEKDVINAMNRLGVNIAPEEAYGDWYALAKQYGISKEEFDVSFDQRKTWEESLNAGEVPIFSDTYACLDALRNSGVKMGLLSKSKGNYTDMKLNYFNLKKYFDKIAVVSPEVPSKREGAIELIRGLNPSKFTSAYFIGDKEEDVIVAKDIEKEFSLNSRGIYVQREKCDGFPTGVKVVKTLNEIPKFMGVSKWKRR